MVAIKVVENGDGVSGGIGSNSRNLINNDIDSGWFMVGGANGGSNLVKILNFRVWSYVRITACSLIWLTQWALKIQQILSTN